MSRWRKRAPLSGSPEELRDPYLAVQSRADWSIQETLAVLSARQEYTQRRERYRIFGDRIFEDPAWDLLLDLFVMASEGKAVSLAYACTITHAPPETTAKQVAHLEEAGLIRRVPHPSDRSCHYLELSDDAYRNMIEYFSRVRKAYFEPRE